jgi:hypothetical protein
MDDVRESAKEWIFAAMLLLPFAVALLALAAAR